MLRPTPEERLRSLDASLDFFRPARPHYVIELEALSAFVAVHQAQQGPASLHQRVGV